MSDFTPGQLAAARAHIDQAIAHVDEALRPITSIAQDALTKHDPETVAAILHQQFSQHHAGPEDTPQALAMLALAVTRLAEALNREAARKE